MLKKRNKNFPHQNMKKNKKNQERLKDLISVKKTMKMSL